MVRSGRKGLWYEKLLAPALAELKQLESDEGLLVEINNKKRYIRGVVVYFSGII